MPSQAPLFHPSTHAQPKSPSPPPTQFCLLHLLPYSSILPAPPPLVFLFHLLLSFLLLLLFVLVLFHLPLLRLLLLLHLLLLLFDVSPCKQTTLELSSSRPVVAVRAFVVHAVVTFVRKSPIFQFGPICRDTQHRSSGARRYVGSGSVGCLLKSQPSPARSLD